MGLFANREIKFFDASDYQGRRNASRTTNVQAISPDRALRNSAVWACLRTRADLISTFPLDVLRRLDGRQYEVPKPAVLVNPGGKRVGWMEWAYSTQVDLDRLGNCYGIITERDSLGLPARIDLVDGGTVTVKALGTEVVSYRVGGTTYDPIDVWHEKQYTVAGCHVGLSPVAYAAWTLGEYASIQQFALDWFGSNAIPSAVLRNVTKSVQPDLAREVRDRFKATVGQGDVLVLGNEWEYDMVEAKFSETNWLDGKAANLVDVCRFFGVPADLIDAAVSGQSITYANMSQRNLQFLIYNLGPVIARREWAISTYLLPSPRYVKFNTDSLLRMDPATRATMLASQVAARLRTASEARELDNLAPYTTEQIAEFDTLYGAFRRRPQDASSTPYPQALAAGSASPDIHVHVAPSRVEIAPADVRVQVDSPVTVAPAEVTVHVPAPEPVTTPPSRARERVIVRDSAGQISRIIEEGNA